MACEGLQSFRILSVNFNVIKADMSYTCVDQKVLKLIQYRKMS